MTTEKTVPVLTNERGQILDPKTLLVDEQRTVGSLRIPPPPAGFRREVKVVYVSADRARYLGVVS